MIQTFLISAKSDMTPIRMSTAQLDLHELAAKHVAARPKLDPPRQRAAIALYRLLADGRPVARERAAGLDEHPGVFFDDDGSIVGFWGMSLEPTAHHFTVDGRELYAWCAWDTLFLPELIGRAARIHSTCPTTGRPIELAVAPGRIVETTPSGAALSFLRREEPFDADTIRTFCRFVHFFASAGAAAQWTAEQPGTFVLSLDDGMRLARLVNRACYPAGLSPRSRRRTASR
jgi:alkylmercury lyase